MFYMSCCSVNIISRSDTLKKYSIRPRAHYVASNVEWSLLTWVSHRSVSASWVDLINRKLIIARQERYKEVVGSQTSQLSVHSSVCAAVGKV